MVTNNFVIKVSRMLVTVSAFFLPVVIVAILVVFMTKMVNSQETHMKINGNSYLFELAKTLEERKKGLSGRVNLPQNSGMLFDFGKPGYYGIWMKDMNFPIDIIWIGGDFKIVDISTEISPATFPKTFLPKDPVQYVLEVNSGWAEQNKVAVRDSVDFTL